jgi:hypothetical protein
LRRWVFLSGACLTAAGAVTILVLPLGLPLRLPAACAWSLLGALRLASLAAAYRSYRRIHLDADGSLLLESGDGAQTPGRIGPGSIALSRVAWLRVVKGERFLAGELLRGNGRESEAWRRFQVIWRHLGSAG